MQRLVCKGKIHRATVTEADLHYVGSISLDASLMAAANIRPYEMVQITNLSNGVIWHTYAIPAAAGSGTVALNGPPARHFQPGDLVIILSLAWVSDEEYEQVKPTVLLVDGKNRVQRVIQQSLPGDVTAEPQETEGRTGMDGA